MADGGAAATVVAVAVVVLCASTVATDYVCIYYYYYYYNYRCNYKCDRLACTGVNGVTVTCRLMLGLMLVVTVTG